MQIPTYLRGYEDLYQQDPRRAAMTWFDQAKYGLFLHYGLYSMLGRGEWVMFHEKMRPGEYAHLAHHFSAERFNADAIADLAVDAGMKYVNITTRHHDGFCLWDSQASSFTTTRAAACKRDLVAELAAACDKRGLGLCLYYSHGRDWKHPHAPNNEDFFNARPAYDPPELTYAHGAGHNLDEYLDFMRAQVAELLTDYGPIASIWLDGIWTPLKPQADRYSPDDFKCQQLYDLVHELQPQCLVSYKNGYTGTEDYFAPEMYHDPEGTAAANPGKLLEMCGCVRGTAKSGAWGYVATAPLKDEAEVYDLVSSTLGRGWNMLLNTGPLPDGSIHPDEAALLRRIGQKLRDASLVTA